MKIDLYTCCYNEIDILPFVVDYWKATVDHVIVYDNYSTDNSVNYLKQFNWIDVIEYSTNNLLNDYSLLNIKNTAWKKSKTSADFVIICDLDECVYAKNFKKILKNFIDNNIIGITPLMCNLISKKFPKYNKNKLLHEIITKYYIDVWDKNDSSKLTGIKQKTLIFNPNKLITPGYKVGCYESMPIGDGKFICTDQIKCFHLHDVGLSRKIVRYHTRALRMSNENIRDHLSDFYNEQPTKIISDFELDLKNAKTLS